MSSAFVDIYGNDPACFREGMPPATQQGSFRILSFVGPSSLAGQRIGGGPQAWLFTHVLQAQSRHFFLGPFSRDAEAGGRQEAKPTLV